MRRLTLVATALTLLGVIAIPAGAIRQPQFVGTGWNNAGFLSSTLFDHQGEEWVLTVSTAYVYTDFLRYSDGQIVEPHTDAWVSLCAYQNVEGAGCGEPAIWLEGTTNLVGSDDATLVPLTSASLEGVLVEVSDGENSGSVVVDVDWLAYGDRFHDVFTGPGGVSENWRRLATISGTVAISGLPSDHPLSVFNDLTLDVVGDLTFDYAEMVHSNAGLAFGE